MNLVLSAPRRLRWENTRWNWKIGKRVGWVKRFGVTGFVIAFLLAVLTSPVAAQFQQPAVITVNQTIQEAVEKNSPSHGV